MLKLLQRQLTHDILAAEVPLTGNYCRHPSFSAQQLLQVYHHNYVDGLLEALQTTYPKLIALVGDEFFIFLAKGFIQARPFSQGHLTLFGSEFPAYIAQSKHCASLPYLADMARLEWAFELAYNAPDIHHQRISAINELRYNPSCQIIHSDFPLFDIWQFDGSSTLDITAGGQSVLVWKHQYKVLLECVVAEVAENLKHIGSCKGQEQIADLLDWHSKGVVY